MKTTYKLTPMRKIVNVVMRTMIRLDMAPAGMRILTFTGRKSGRTFSTPVTLVVDNGLAWLVAPYGEVPWVKNVRAAGIAEFHRGGKTEQYRVKELSGNESGPVLKKYVSIEPITQSFFTARPESPVEDFIREAAAHPVFALQSLQPE